MLRDFVSPILSFFDVLRNETLNIVSVPVQQVNDLPSDRLILNFVTEKIL